MTLDKMSPGRRWHKFALGVFIFVIMASCAVAQTTSSGKREQLPPQSTEMKEVLVPVPREIFEALDRFADSNWRRVQRPDIAEWRPRGGQVENALSLGVVIAEGFVAAAAKDAVEVKSVGDAVLRFTRALGVERVALRRSRSIVEHAEKGDWPAVRREWDRLLPDVQRGMKELQSEPLAQLVSLGGWLRGAGALTSLVLQNFPAEDAELLRQKAVLDYFARNLAEMDDETRANPLVARMAAGLPKIRQLLAADEKPMAKETVKKISGVAEGLLKDLDRKRGR